MSDLPFKTKRIIYFLLLGIGFVSVIIGFLNRATDQGLMFLYLGFVLFMVSLPINTKIMRCKTCKVSFNYVPQNSPYAQVIRKFKAFNYLLHLRTLTHCQNEKCGVELD